MCKMADGLLVVELHKAPFRIVVSAVSKGKRTTVSTTSYAVQRETKREAEV